MVQLARETKAGLVLANEEEVRTACQGFNLEVVGCLGVILKAVGADLISPENAQQNLKKLIESGYRIDQISIQYFEKAVRRLKKR